MLAVAGCWVRMPRVRCACNSRLNLVRLFVNPSHPTRARTPPCGCLCARLPAHACVCLHVPAPVRPVVYCACACALVHAGARPVVSAPVRACLCCVCCVCMPVHLCACLCAPGILPVRAVRLAACARAVRSRFLGCGGCLCGSLASFAVPARCTCVFCSSIRALLCALCALCAYLFCLWLPSGYSGLFPPSLMPGGSLAAGSLLLSLALLVVV